MARGKMGILWMGIVNTLSEGGDLGVVLFLLSN